MEMYLNMSSEKWRPFCPGVIELKAIAIQMLTALSREAELFPLAAAGCCLSNELSRG